jgi:hypothetical protein
MVALDTLISSQNDATTFNLLFSARAIRGMYISLGQSLSSFSLLVCMILMHNREKFRMLELTQDLVDMLEVLT